MIRTFEVKLNAAFPELPIFEAAAFVGSPSTAIITNVPAKVGTWEVTSIAVAYTYPDSTAATKQAVHAAPGVWLCTLPATMTSGRVASGFQVLADGTDENGDAVTGYVLGIADFAVYSRETTIAPSGAPAWTMHLFDAVPAVARKGDVAPVNGILKIYNGTNWIPFADLTGYATVDALTQGLSQKQDKLTDVQMAKINDAATEAWTGDNFLSLDGGDMRGELFMGSQSITFSDGASVAVSSSGLEVISLGEAFQFNPSGGDGVVRRTELDNRAITEAGVARLRRISEADYNALTNKELYTLYLIPEV